jgi:hypothetical protein
MPMTALAEIQIKQRFRKEPGDLVGLMQSIERVGLLHPVVITPDKVLVAGARRLFACKELGWADIPTREVDLPAIIQGEHDENECRKDFTKSERVAIVGALRSFKHGGNRRSVQGRARDVETAAKQAGFESRAEFFRARTVVEHGAPELVEAMDSGAISTERAAEVAALPVEQQREAVALPTPKEARQLAREQGGLVLAANGKWVDGRSTAEVAADKARTAVIYQFIGAVEALATMPETPPDYIANLPPYEADHINEFLPRAEAWLTEFCHHWKGVEP